VWAAGQLIATYSPDQNQAVLNFELSDWLGTRRVLTDSAGDVEQICHSLPYGDGEDCQPTPTEHLFTGKERDSESGNDYFGARYYASTMGRFLSPDWSAKIMPVPYAKLGDPQTLNLYSYVGNNPLSRTDPSGH
jgi:RHS repeat-associated protein